jgi:hypothetical protein
MKDGEIEGQYHLMDQEGRLFQSGALIHPLTLMVLTLTDTLKQN